MDNLDALYAAAFAGDADAISKLEMEADRLNENEQTILHIESIKGNTERVRFILREFADKNLLVKLGNQNETALCWAAYYGHTEVVEVLIDAARRLPDPSANDNPVTSFQSFLRHADQDLETALYSAVKRGHLAAAKLLAEADPSGRHIQNKLGKTPIYIAAQNEDNHIVKMICTTCTPPHNLDGPRGSTALHAAIRNLNHDIQVVEVLIGAVRLSSSSSSSSSDKDDTHTCFQAFLTQCDEDLNTALHIAIRQGKLATAKLLVEADPTATYIQNKRGETPIYIAVERGYIGIVKMICTTCTALSNLDGPSGSTALHAAIKNLHQVEKEDRDVIAIIIAKYVNTLRDGVADKSDKDSDNIDREIYEDLVGLFNKTDEDRWTILELAVEQNEVDVVKLIVAQNPAYAGLLSHDIISLMPLIYKATDKKYTDIVKLLTQTYQNPKSPWTVSTSPKGFGQYLLCRDMTRLISAIGGRQREMVSKMLESSATRFVTFADNLGWTALHHAAYHEFDLIIDTLIEAQKTSGHQFLYEDKISTPFHVAAEKRYTSIVILLMKLWPCSSSAYTAVDRNGQNILHLAALQSEKEMIQGILKHCSEEYKCEFVNKQDKNGDTPLHILIRRGCFVPELMKYRGLNTVIKNKEMWTPPEMLYFEDQIIDDQVQIKIALETNHKTDYYGSLVLLPSKKLAKDVLLNKQAKLLKEDLERYRKTHPVAYCFADAIVGDVNARAALEIEADTVNEEGETILHRESHKGDSKNVRYIVKEFANKNLLGKLDNQNQTAVHLAAHHGHTEVAEVLIDAARHLPSCSTNDDDTHNPVSAFQAFIRQATGPTGNTALHVAVINGNVATVKLLVEADLSDAHIQNYQGKTPIYIAAEKGYKDIIKVICTTCTALSLEGPGGRTTAFHAAILNMHKDKEDSDVIRMLISAAKRWSPENAIFEDLFSRTDDSGRTILELAVYRNCVEVVKLMLVEGPANQHGRGSKNNSFMRSIYTAIDQEYNDILKLLTDAYEADITLDHKGVTDLIVAIGRRDRVSVIRLLGENKQLVTFADEDGMTPLHLAAYHQFDSILELIIEAQKDVGHLFAYSDKYVPTPFHIAAKKGYTLTVIRLMELWPASSSAYTNVNNDGRNILHLAALKSKKEMIKGILKHCPKRYKDQMVNKQDNNGDTPLHLLIMRGCFIPEILQHKGLETMTKNKKDQTPLDYFYLEEQIIADQVQIKITLDDIDTDQSWKCWRKNIKVKSNYLESVVLPNRREAKDVQFENAKKDLVDKKHGQMKRDLEKYKKRTNTQIVVTALITTVAFTVGFTMPGGLYQSGELDQGLVILSKKTAFRAFMVSDALALLLSTCCLFLYFLESMYEDLDQVAKLNTASTALNIVSVVAMMLTFITGTYVVLCHSPALAITVCIIGSFFFLFVIVLLIKMVYDRQVKKKNED